MDSNKSAPPTSQNSSVQSTEASSYCPTCSEKLIGRGCKLRCPKCGFYLSCSDYY